MVGRLIRYISSTPSYSYHHLINPSIFLSFYIGNLCLGGTDSGRIYVWDLVSCHRPLAVLHGHCGAVNTMNFSVDGMTMMMVMMMMVMMFIIVMMMVMMMIMMMMAMMVMMMMMIIVVMMMIAMNIVMIILCYYVF